MREREREKEAKKKGFKRKKKIKKRETLNVKKAKKPKRGQKSGYTERPHFFFFFFFLHIGKVEFIMRKKIKLYNKSFVKKIHFRGFKS